MKDKAITKTYIIFLVLVWVVCEVKGESNSISIDELREAIIQVETLGDPTEIGDNGKAFGLLQIHEVMIDDYNRIYGTNYSHSDSFDVEIATKIFNGIMWHYGNHINRTTNKEVNAKHLAFIWNGGGGAWKYVDDPNYGKEEKRKNLEIYWKKVLTQLR